jgi:cell division septation protein DedD
VQVGAYRDSAQAQVLADGLSASGHKVIVSDAQAGEVIMHKVRIGPFETWRAARDEADRLAAYKTLDQLAASLKK